MRTRTLGSRSIRDVVPQGQGSTTSTVSVGALEDLTLYAWRARAESDGAPGPWSAIYGFTTAFALVEPPTLLLPTGGIVTGTLRPFFTAEERRSHRRCGHGVD